MNRLQQQIQFIVEVDKLKLIFRKSRLMDRSRYENDAEHTWHLMMMAMILLEHANEEKINPLQVLKMLLIHDLVEIDAGDTFAYDEIGHLDKAEREEKAAKRIFGLLPDEQHEEMYRLWREFEDRTTPEAQFAAALDRLQPLIHNYYTEGESWQKYGITSAQVINRNKQIAEGSTTLWSYAEEIIRASVAKGYLKQS
jgi:putative hydrolase of HD superfamily